MAIPLSQALLDLSVMVGLWAAPRVSLEAHPCRDQKLHLSTGSHQVSSADSQNVGPGHKSSHRAAAAEKPQRKKHQRQVLQHTLTFWGVPGSKELMAHAQRRPVMNSRPISVKGACNWTRVSWVPSCATSILGRWLLMDMGNAHHPAPTNAMN